MDALVGSDFTRRMTWVQAGAPVTLATASYSLYDRVGAPLGALAPAEEGNGVYAFSGDASLLTLPGVYTGRVTFSKGPLSEFRVERFQVGHWQPGLLPRWELVHRVARACQDLWIGQCTATSTTLVVDTNNRWEPDHYFQGAEVYLYAGTGRGQSRRVQAWANLSRAATVAPFLVGVTTDTRYQFTKKFTVADYWDAINRAIARVRTHALIPLSDESVITLAPANIPTHEYAIPGGMDYISRVQWKDTTAAYADWEELDLATKDWDVLPGARLYLATVKPNRQLRLIGQMLPADLTADDTWCTLDSEYVVPQAAAYLLEQRVHSVTNDAEDARGRMSYLQGVANQRAPNGRPWPNSMRVL